MTETVAAVVVTYNRKQLLTECLDALLGQSRLPDKIIVIDNASSDGTPELLKEHGYLGNPMLDYVRMETNTGGAGGFHEGMRRAYEAGYQWIWVMDDDAEPKSDSLQRLMDFRRTNVDALAMANLKVGVDGVPQWNHHGDLNLSHIGDSVLNPISESDIHRPFKKVTNSSFVGLAVTRTVIDKIGLPEREFFIHHDDFEYCYRMSKTGIPIYLIPASIIVHKDQRGANLAKKSLAGRESARIPIERLWLYYFGFRNLVWLRRTHCSFLLAAAFGIKRLSRAMIGIMLYDDHKLLRIRFWMNAFIDGMTGNFDNKKPKSLCDSAKR